MQSSIWMRSTPPLLGSPPLPLSVRQSAKQLLLIAIVLRRSLRGGQANAALSMADRLVASAAAQVRQLQQALAKVSALPPAEPVPVP